MSIVITKRGDDGHTDILFGKRLPKTARLFAVLGDLDEVKVALGFVRYYAEKEHIIHTAEVLQQRIVEISGRLCVSYDCVDKYEASQLAKFYPENEVTTIEQRAEFFEKELDWDKTWSTPGNDLVSTYLEQARVVARRAERNYLMWLDSFHGADFYDEKFEKLAHIWLNRLSDLLWLMAQYQTK